MNLPRRYRRLGSRTQLAMLAGAHDVSIRYGLIQAVSRFRTRKVKCNQIPGQDKVSFTLNADSLL